MLSADAGALGSARDNAAIASPPPFGYFAPSRYVCGHRGRFMSTAGIVAVVAAGVAFAVLAAIVVWLLLMRDV